MTQTQTCFIAITGQVGKLYFKGDVMEIKDIQREQMFCQIVQERDAIILDLNSQVIQLKTENEKYKQIINDLDKKENPN